MAVPKLKRECSFHVLVATEARMVLFFALEADFCITKFTLDHFDATIGSNHCSFAVRFDAVSQKQICIFN